MITDSPGLAWDAPSLQGADTLELTSTDFDHNGPLSRINAAGRAGGQNLSPALSWTRPADAVQLLLIVEDPDAGVYYGYSLEAKT